MLARTTQRYGLPALLVIAVGVAGCGGGSTPTAPTKSSTRTQSAASGIPQGPNAGDRDSDNNGGPSDGDGNI